MINYDGVEFSEYRSKEVLGFFDAQCMKVQDIAVLWQTLDKRISKDMGPPYNIIQNNIL